MSTYAIGDIQGCFDPLMALLEHIQFDSKKDTLWFAGDLVNRGPKSLQVLRFVKSLANKAITVLGNHDLHLLAVAFAKAKVRRSDTLSEILTASDGEELCHWLRCQPLLHHDANLGYTLVHAGIFPEWDLATATKCAQELEATLQGEHYVSFLSHMYGDAPDHWSAELTGLDRLRFITNVYTRMRLCTKDNRLNLKNKGPLTDDVAEGLPWFLVPGRANAELKILFGHWAALECKVNVPGIYALDSGCVWGNRLTALRLEDEKRFSVGCGSGDRRQEAGDRK